jgi:hypothetical protein
MSQELMNEKKEKCKIDRDSLERLNDIALNMYSYDLFVPYGQRNCFGYFDSLFPKQLDDIFEDAEETLNRIFGDDVILAAFIDAENNLADFVVTDYSETEQKWNIEVWRLSFSCPSSLSDEEED